MKFLLLVMFTAVFATPVCHAVEWSAVDSVPTELVPAHPARAFTIDDMADDEDILGDIYIQPSHNDPIIELGTKSILPQYSINSFRDDEVRFTTGRQQYISAYLYWKWLAVGYSFPMHNYTNGYSFSFCPTISNFLVELNVSKIKKYKSNQLRHFFSDDDEEEEEVVEDIMLDGLETFEWNCSAEWALNKQLFSSSSLFSQSYSSGQRVNAGSLLVGGSFGQNCFKLNPSSSRSDTANAILAKLPMQDNSITNFSVGFGYGYNFVVKQGVFVIGMMLIPYMSGAWSHYKLENENVDQFCYGLRAHGRINCVYQYHYGFLSVSTDMHGLYFFDNKFTYFQTNMAFYATAALKLGSLGITNEKIPGHQIIDYIDRWF